MYTPPSSSLTALMVSVCPFSLVWNLVPDSDTGAPFRVHVWSGTGSPFAVQRRVAVLPLTTATDAESALTTGTTEWKDTKILNSSLACACISRHALEGQSKALSKDCM